MLCFSENLSAILSEHEELTTEHESLTSRHDKLLVDIEASETKWQQESTAEKGAVFAEVTTTE